MAMGTPSLTVTYVCSLVAPAGGAVSRPATMQTTTTRTRRTGVPPPAVIRDAVGPRPWRRGSTGARRRPSAGRAERLPAAPAHEPGGVEGPQHVGHRARDDPRGEGRAGSRTQGDAHHPVSGRQVHPLAARCRTDDR